MKTLVQLIETITLKNLNQNKKNNNREEVMFNKIFISDNLLSDYNLMEILINSSIRTK